MDIDDVDLANIRAFELVATLGTLSAAAARLGLTVPAVSAKIKRLETLCDCSLFERAGNRIALTAAGQTMMRELAPLLDEGRRFVKAMHDLRRGERPRTEPVSLVIAPDYSGYFLPLIETFLRERNDLDVEVRIARSSDALQLLQTGKANICIGVFQKTPKTISTEPLATTTMSILNPAEVNGRSGQGSRLFLMAPRGQITRRFLAQAAIAPDRVLECPTCQSAISLAARSNYPAAVHTLCLKISDYSALPSIEVLGHERTQIVAAYLKDGPRARVIDTLLDRLKAAP
jgi:LysR family hydrogen peroxide-inducible transcriptional activator